MVEYLKKENVGISWSFDGLWQDSQRPHKHINDTLSIYKAKKDLIKELSPSNCKTMVSPNSIKTMVENFEFLVEEFEVDEDFLFVVFSYLTNPWRPDFGISR